MILQCPNIQILHHHYVAIIFQNPSVLEILAPYLGHVSASQRFELGVNPSLIELVRPD